MRISRDQLFLEMAMLLAKRSTCVRGNVGCVIVRDNRVIATGYNGAPPGMSHCFDVGCDLARGDDQGCQRAIHAEVNALAFAARHGVATAGATSYQTHGPCPACAKLQLSAGIAKVIRLEAYRLPEGEDMLAEAGVTIVGYERPQE